MSMDWWLNLDSDYIRKIVEFGLGRSIEHCDDRMLEFQFHDDFVEISAEYLQCTSNNSIKSYQVIETDEVEFKACIEKRLPILNKSPDLKEYPKYTIRDGGHRLNYARSIGVNHVLVFVSEKSNSGKVLSEIRCVHLDEIVIPEVWEPEKIRKIKEWATQQTLQMNTFQRTSKKMTFFGKPIINTDTSIIRNIDFLTLKDSDPQIPLVQKDCEQCGVIHVKEILRVPAETKLIDEVLKGSS